VPDNACFQNLWQFGYAKVQIPCALGLNDIVTYGPANKVGKGLQLQLSHHRRPVGLDRFHTQRETARYVLIAVALGEQLYDLPFSGRYAVACQADRAGFATF